MFRVACAIAANFTFPVILCRRDTAGQCSAAIGTYVVINDDGWIVTAGHILEQWEKMAQELQEGTEHAARRAAIDADKSLDHKARQKKLRELGRPDKLRTDKCSIYWGGSPQAKITQMARLNWVDLGIGKLEPFDPGAIKQYPVFKDPSKNFDTGTSLCKLGFPFHTFRPTYDETRDSFILPPGALPAPFFPIDGIFSRVAELVVEGAPPPPFPMQWVETSTPGLRGQSGGPTYDSKGTIWAIQCNTASLPLDFHASIGQQYLHVGRGVHPTTMFRFFDQMKIKYAVSDY